MNTKVLLCFLMGLQSVMVYAINGQTDTINPGRLVPSAFGAKGDGFHDDTSALQTALDSLDRMGGGAVYLGSGTYMVSSIRLGKKTSLIGCGNGATIIKQIKGTNGDCVIVQAKSAALRISNLSIVGNDSNCGLMIEDSNGGTENHPYVYTKTIKDNVPQPYKWMTIDDVCIYHFGTGMNIERDGFNINISNSTFSHNGEGVILKCTDSSMYNCYITNNWRRGLAIGGSNNKISNVKSIFNGIENAKTSAAIIVYGARNQIENCETQDNYCSGFVVNGEYNLISNCISNTDGYAKEPKGYVPSVEACGFKIKGLYNSFSNCAVTNYNEKYGAVFHSPVIVDDAVAHYYPDIFNTIKVLIAKDRLMFHDPFRNVQILTSKNIMQSVHKEIIDGSEYFISLQRNNNVIKSFSYGLSSFNVLVDFKCRENDGNIVSVTGLNQLTISVEGNRCLYLSWDGQKKAELVLDKDAVMNQDDLRLILSFCQTGEKLTISLLCYEKTAQRGWIKKEIRQDADILVPTINDATVKIGDTGVAVKRLAVTHSPLPESVFLPYSNTNGIYDGSIIYVDAESTF